MPPQALLFVPLSRCLSRCPMLNPLAVPAPHLSVSPSFCCHTFSLTNHFLSENHRSLIQLCITPSLESTPWFIPSAPRQSCLDSPLHSLVSSLSLSSIIIITTLIIHHFFTLSLQAQNLPFQQILPTLILLPPCTAFTITGPDRTYHASRSIFSSFFLLFVRVVD